MHTLRTSVPTSWGFLLCLLFRCFNALQLEGTWNPQDRYQFLTKFGFQRTQVDELEATRGYIYGNVELKHGSLSASNSSDLATLVLVDSEFILDLYGNGTEPVWFHDQDLRKDGGAWLIENERCRRMFAMIDRIAWHRNCAPAGQMDLLRTVPCPTHGLCVEEDNMQRVVGPSQFTYTVQDLRQPRYWYLSLVACVRNATTCEWETTSVPRPDSSRSLLDHTLTYDIWLVNGAPHLQGYNKFEHQFSFEAHDTVEMYLVFFALYLVLVVYVHFKMPSYRIANAYLFAVHVWLCAFGCLLTTIHLSVFSSDGRGLGRLSEVGTLMTQWSDAVFLVLLLSTAHMGFVPERFLSIMTNDALNVPGGHKHSRLLGQEEGSLTDHVDDKDGSHPEASLGRSWPFLFCLSTSFLVVKTVLYLWASFDQDPVIDFSVWNTIPGCILLTARFCVAFWFLAILRRRQVELDEAGIDVDYLGPGIDLAQFAAGYLLWMFVLPLVVFVAETSVSSLWRSKTILSVCFSGDYVAACAYAYLLFRSCDRIQSCESFQ